MRQMFNRSDAAEKKPHLYTVIKNYCEDNTSFNGLFLIDMPTGFGKTHSVLDYIFTAACSEALQDRKIFFVTTLKKNLPILELQQRFEKAGESERFHKKFLFLDSNADCVVTNFSQDLAITIPAEIRHTEEYKAFAQDVIFLQKQQKSTIDELRSFVPSIRDNLRCTSEPNFRRLIQSMLAKQFKTSTERLNAIKKNPQWQWLGKLYPAVFTKERQIIFMSMDKFLSQNSTIIEPSCMVYNSPIIKNALVFIDEFDATKDTILNNIIQSGLRDKIDYLDLFREIYAALQTSKFPSRLTVASQQRQNSAYKDQHLQSVIDGLKEKAEEIYQEYSLQFSYKTDTELVDTSKNFLFQDHQFHSILDGNKSYIVTACDSKRRVNTIQFSTERPAAERNNIQFLLGKLRGFIKFFQGAVNILAINYYQYKMEHRQDGQDDFSSEFAIRTVLAEFSLSDFYKDYITSQILTSSHKNAGNIAGSEYDLQFYENGFRYYAFLDEPSHDMRSRIMMYGFQNTPEKLLLRFCEKAKVIGISATATLPSVLGNYDLAYLKSKMNQAYTELSVQDKAILAQEFQQATSGYNKINIHTKVISGVINGDYNEAAWNTVFRNHQFSKKIFIMLEQFLAQEPNSYNKERYLRIAKVYKEFIAHSDIQSFLCVLTKHPKKGDVYLNLDVLYQIFALIHKEHSVTYSPQRMVCQLDGEDYDLKKDAIQQRLEQGEKLFVISVYQTIGAGQNLQYKIPHSLVNQVCTTNGFPARGEKDFDAIYLDKPTNMIVNLTDNLSEEEFIKYLFQIEFLQEVAELSMKDAFSHIKRAFITYYSGHSQANRWAANIYNCHSSVLLSTRTIIQAIGRICRTNQKRRNVYVFADSRLSECLDASVAKGRLMNWEFLVLLKQLRQSTEQTIVYKNWEDAASLLSVRVNKHINNFLAETWADERIRKWKELRNLTLKYPTLPEESVFKNFMAKNFYVESPIVTKQYWYHQNRDFNNIQVSFTKAKEYPFEVSELAARLPQLMKIPGILELFQQHRYATSFAPNKYMMSPALFHNVYKGALGEVVGKFILEQVVHIPLEEITDPQQFELFDYKIQNTSVFIDFKHWMESTDFDATEMNHKIVQKAKRCNASCVVIINILSDHVYDATDIQVDQVRIIKIPTLVKIKENGQYAVTNHKLLKELVAQPILQEK